MSDKPRLQVQYEESIRQALAEKHGYKNPHQIPRLEKITLNMGVGSAIQEKKHLEYAVDALTQITGQKPIITKARKSIAGFKVREEMPLGVKVTLRGDRMYDFLDRLITIALPRTRDFKGISGKAFDDRAGCAVLVELLRGEPFLVIEEILSSFTTYWALPFGILLILSVLFIKGGESGYIQAEHQQAILSRFPAASFKIIAGAGHLPHVEKPAIFTRLVDNFLIQS